MLFEVWMEQHGMKRLAAVVDRERVARVFHGCTQVEVVKTMGNDPIDDLVDPRVRQAQSSDGVPHAQKFDMRPHGVIQPYELVGPRPPFLGVLDLVDRPSLLNQRPARPCSPRASGW